MATVNRNSTVITDQVATPKVLVSPSKGSPAPLVSTSGYVANAADDSATSVHRFCRVPSNATLRQLLFTSGVATTGGAINLGVYRTVPDGGAAVSASLFASAYALTGSANANTEMLFKSGTFTTAMTTQPLWQALGLSADPQCDYDIASTISTTFNAAAVGQAITVNYVV